MEGIPTLSFFDSGADIRLARPASLRGRRVKFFLFDPANPNHP
jgi:hypothetical protein